jgi:hypothetical protein
VNTDFERRGLRVGLECARAYDSQSSQVIEIRGRAAFYKDQDRADDIRRLSGAGIISSRDHGGGPWMLQGEAPTLVETLVEALGNLAVTS